MRSKNRKDAPRGSTKQERKRPRRSRKRPSGKPFPKGVSGNPARRFGVPETGNPINPGGRPRSAKELAALAQEHGAAVLEELASLALTGYGRRDIPDQPVDEEDEDARPVRRRAPARWQDRIRAGDIVLERGYGRAPQPITGPDGGPIGLEDISRMTTEQRNRELAALMAKATGADLAAPAPEPVPAEPEAPQQDGGDAEPGGD